MVFLSHKQCRFYFVAFFVIDKFPAILLQAADLWRDFFGNEGRNVDNFFNLAGGVE